MTIKECIDIVDNAKPNQYGIKEKVMWLSFVDETIINDVLKTHEGYDGRFDNFEGYTEDKLSVPLIVPSPYDRLYPQYIKMMIDSENGETARYNNSAALYNTYLNEYKKYYNKTHMPINATQKIPSPVSININSHLSDAQIEYIKRQLYYMLSQDVGEVISHDKLYDIAMEYYQNNTEVLKGKDGKSGAMIYSFPFAEWNTGEEYHINFDWENQYNKDDHPGADAWNKGDIVITANGKVAEITNVIRHSAERWFVDFRCFADIMGKDGSTTNVVEATLDENGVYNITLDDYDSYKLGDMFFVKCVNAAEVNYENIKHLYIKINSLDTMYISNVPEDVAAGNAILMPNFFVYYTEMANIESISKREASFMMVNTIKEFIESDAVPEGKYANIDLSNVSDEDFKAKAEAAGVGGDAGLAEEKCIMEFKGVVDVLPYWANEGEVYKPKSDYVTEKQYNNPDNFHYSVDYIGEKYVVFGGGLFEYFKEAYEKSTTKSGYLMFDNGEYWEEFYFTIENVEGDAVTFANADQSKLERAFSYPVGHFSIYNVLIVPKGKSAVYHNGEWIPLVD